MKDQFTTDLYEKLVSDYRLAHEKFTERQLADCIRQMLLSGDFERHIDALNQQAIVYIPYARQQGLEFERDALLKRLQKLEAAADVFAREAGYLERIEDAERRADSADADARSARDTALYGTGK